LLIFLVLSNLLEPSDLPKIIFRSFLGEASKEARVSLVKAAAMGEASGSDKAVEAVGRVFERFERPVVSEEEFVDFFKN
jgi:hypothetical protein